MKIKILNYEFKSLITDYRVIKPRKPVSFLTEKEKTLFLKPLINLDFEKNKKRR